MLYYVTQDKALAENIISVIDNALGYPTQYTQTWAVPQQRVTDQAWYVDVPHIDIPIPFGNVSTETYSIDWLPPIEADTGNV
jgi:hypothetical protein